MDEIDLTNAILYANTHRRTFTMEPTLTQQQLEMKHTPELIAEAAMCIWEAMMDARGRIDHRLDRTVDPAWNDQMDRLWNDYGTVEMRHYAYRLALVALEVFEELGYEEAEARNLIPYDWEFIPTVVSRADWSSLYAPDNRPSRILAELRED